MNMIELDPLIDDLTEFIGIPQHLTPEFASPMRAALETQQLSPGNLFFTHGKARAFLLKDDHGIALGRILASTDQNLEQKTAKKVGHIGFFDCVDHHQAAQYLFDAAEHWLKNEGCDAAEGPLNLNIYTGYRVQISGFETMPFPGEPRNPAYYPALLEQSGYTTVATWNSWDVPVSFLEETVEHSRAALLERGTEEVKHRRANTQEFEKELRFIHRCILDIFSQNYGYSEISEDEWVQTTIYRQPLMTDDLFRITLDDAGQPTGVVMGFPDDPQKPTRSIFHTFGTLSSQRKTSIPYLLINLLFEEGLRRGLPAVGALCTEGRTTFDRHGPPSRSYVVMHKPL